MIASQSNYTIHSFLDGSCGSVTFSYNSDETVREFVMVAFMSSDPEVGEMVIGGKITLHHDVSILMPVDEARKVWEALQAQGWVTAQ